MDLDVTAALFNLVVIMMTNIARIANTVQVTLGLLVPNPQCHD